VKIARLSSCKNFVSKREKFIFAVPLRILTEKVSAMLYYIFFQPVGIISTKISDCASNFTSSLTTTFLKMFGCSHNYNVPGWPQQTGLCERLIGTLKRLAKWPRITQKLGINI